MIPNVRNGHSFQGAGQYYLHDKALERANGKKPREYLTTSERVEWTKTLNCVNDDPELALIEMIATARSQQQLKAAAGLAPGGRPTDLSVKTVSLSWHPDEEPTREEIEAAALSYLQKMGWHEHQTLLVAHNDTPHDHVHMIINRVHPETGRTLNDWQDQRRSQQWALEYEREHGRVWCDARVEKYPDGRPIDPSELAHELAVNMRNASRPGPGEAGRDARSETWDELRQRQKDERIGFFEEGKAEFRAVRQQVFWEVRTEFKPYWQEHFTWGKDLEKEAKEWSEDTVKRALYFAQRGEFNKGLDALVDREAVLKAVRKEIAAAANELEGEQKRITRDLQDQAVDSRRADREVEYQEVLWEQLQERRQFKLHEQSDGRASWNARGGHYGGPPVANNNNVIDDQQVPLSDLVPPPLVRAEDDYVEWHPPAADVHETISVTGAADLGAGAIGSLAGYLADEMAELFAPTPPEIREVRAKAADREEEVQRDSTERRQFNAYARAAESAIRRAEEEREIERNRAYWEARERDRDQ